MKGVNYSALTFIVSCWLTILPLSPKFLMVLTGKKRSGCLIKWENIRKVKAVDLTADFLSMDETLKKIYSCDKDCYKNRKCQVKNLFM